jgi:hypothetical protein
MELKPVNSSNLRKIGYDPATNILIIVFNSGSTYEFQNIPPDLYEDLINAPSIGTFFSKNIRNKPYKKIT